MKRVLVSAAAIAALMSMVMARPVQADVTPTAGTDGIVAQVEDFAYATANSLLGSAPSPGGWSDRHVCVTVYVVNQYWCVNFPFPS